ncbi:hypothetical protein BLNAU_23885 [Blattamonas nauphoetae]|uniref:Uncharacterized protein n=1 Tax=Blattamonas nauphoetae TaxID=2049346 RepID=A0ABQ9WNY1_9EUKA|nr:hypothetical protein BLNAU_23885 [Blattamonas nauphoetae]
MIEYSFGLQTQEVVELLTFKPFELQLLITNSSDIVAEFSSAGQITFSESMLELDKTNELKLTKTDLLNNNSFLSILLTQRSLRPTLAPDFTTLLICVSASKLATDLDWNQVFRPHLLLSPPYKGSPPFTPLFQFLVSFRRAQHRPETEVVFLTSYTLSSTKEGVSAPSHLFRLAAHCHPSLPLLPFSTLLQWRLANKVCGAGEVDLCVLTLSSLLTNTHVAVTQFNQESGEGSWSVVDQKATRDKEERKCV